jgi:hypothetical protein
MHVWSTNKRLNKSRNKHPRVRPLLARQSMPEHPTHVPAPSDARPSALTRARAYKAAQGLDLTPPHALSSAQARVRRTFP